MEFILRTTSSRFEVLEVVVASVRVEEAEGGKRTISSYVATVAAFFYVNCSSLSLVRC